MVVIQVHGVHKRVDDFPAKSRALNVAVTELLHPEDNEIPLNVGEIRFLHADGVFKSAPFSLQFLKAVFCAGGDNSGFNRLHDVFDGSLVFRELLAQAN